MKVLGFKWQQICIFLGQLKGRHDAKSLNKKSPQALALRPFEYLPLENSAERGKEIFVGKINFIIINDICIRVLVLYVRETFKLTFFEVLSVEVELFAELQQFWRAGWRVHFRRRGQTRSVQRHSAVFLKRQNKKFQTIIRYWRKFYLIIFIKQNGKVALYFRLFSRGHRSDSELAFRVEKCEGRNRTDSNESSLSNNMRSSFAAAASCPRPQA